MSTYAYTGCDNAGKSRRGWIEAGSPKRARLLLAAQGIWTENVRPVAHHGQRLSPQWRESLYRDLGALLRAGMPLERALNLLMEGVESRLALAAAVLRDQVREGGGVAESFDRVCGPLPPFEAAALAAAERSGELASALENLAGVLERRRGVRERLATSLVYPAFLVLLGFLLSALMLFVMGPRVVRMMASLGGGVPSGVASALSLARWGWICVVGSVPLVLLAGLRWRRATANDAVRRARFERRLTSLAPVRRVLTALWCMRVAAILGMLKRAGVPLVEALSLAGEASGSAWVSAAAREQAVAVRQGEPLSRAIDAIAPLREGLSEWVRLGEVTGDLDAMLAQAAAQLQQVYERRIARMLALLDPLLVLVIGIFILGVALVVLIPVLDLARHMGGL